MSDWITIQHAAIVLVIVFCMLLWIVYRQDQTISRLQIKAWVYKERYQRALADLAFHGVNIDKYKDEPEASGVGGVHDGAIIRDESMAKASDDIRKAPRRRWDNDR